MPSNRSIKSRRCWRSSASPSHNRAGFTWAGQMEAQQPGIGKEQAGYAGSNTIRGPKVYPHHAQGLVDANVYSGAASNQNRSITGWVKPDTDFEFDLHFTNLSDVELGGLAWLLTLPPDHFLHLGLGKPLGFGSVRAEIKTDGTCVAGGSAWVEAISNGRSWPAGISVDALGRMALMFQRLVDGANPNLLKSFKRAALGLGELPIHYPRLVDQPAGETEHFHWFVQNESRDGGKPRFLISGRRMSRSRGARKMLSVDFRGPIGKYDDECRCINPVR